MRKHGFLRVSEQRDEINNYFDEAKEDEKDRKREIRNEEREARRDGTEGEHCKECGRLGRSWRKNKGEIITNGVVGVASVIGNYMQKRRYDRTVERISQQNADLGFPTDPRPVWASYPWVTSQSYGFPYAAGGQYGGVYGGIGSGSFGCSSLMGQQDQGPYGAFNPMGQMGGMMYGQNPYMQNPYMMGGGGGQQGPWGMQNPWGMMGGGGQQGPWGGMGGQYGMGGQFQNPFNMPGWAQANSPYMWGGGMFQPGMNMGGMNGWWGMNDGSGGYNGGFPWANGGQGGGGCWQGSGA